MAVRRRGGAATPARSSIPVDAGEIFVQVLGPGGRPLPNTLVALIDGDVHHQATTDAAGRVRFQAAPGADHQLLISLLG